MEKLKIEWRVASGKWRVLFCSQLATRLLSLLLLPLLTFYFSVAAHAQNRMDIGAGVDSIHVTAQYMDSLLKVDSISRALRLEDERRFEQTHQLATQRSIDLTGDGVPEVLRLEGHVPKNIDDTRLTFTIKSGKKILYKDSWLAKGYFDTMDHLTDPIKLFRLRRIITIFFANENFEVVDSNDFRDMMKRVDVAEIKPGSAYARELFQASRVMYSVFHSRDYWYGLIWDPKKEKFIKAWRN
ncbi:MAG TPA: hypothetical protein VFD13_06180 [Candidatus Kapabacteria bacterium]|nr:hypothetical protein [Candidatus Kapabacteria bacterium]